MYAVYPLSPGSTWNNNELRFSLRSLEKFVHDVDNVLIIGHKPAQVKNVQHVASKEPYKNPLANLIYKLRLATEALKNEEGFVWMNDDFWLVNDWKVKAVHHKGKLKDAIEKRKVNHENYYYRALVECEMTLRDEGVNDPDDFELHCPMWMETERVRMTLDKYFSGNEEGQAGIFRSFYGNSLPAYCRSGLAADHKLSRHWVLPHGSYSCLSADDFSIHGQWARKWFLKAYPEPSKYEQEEWPL